MTTKGSGVTKESVYIYAYMYIYIDICIHMYIHIVYIHTAAFFAALILQEALDCR